MCSVHGAHPLNRDTVAEAIGHSSKREEAMEYRWSSESEETGKKSWSSANGRQRSVSVGRLTS